MSHTEKQNTKIIESVLHPITLSRTGQTIENNIWLAPMAGTSDLPFRSLCRRFGAGLTVTELVSARGIRFSGTEGGNARYMAIEPAAGPVWIQLFGYEADDFAAACEAILAHPLYSQCDGIDINMGCPVKKVVRTGAGSALLERPQVAAAIVQAVRTALRGTGKSVSVKFRKGFAAHSCTAPDFALRLAEAGADLLTLHGRTTAQMYSGAADWQSIKATAQALNEHGIDIPLIANGDVDSAAAVSAVIRETGAAGVMIGRAAQGKPWIFKTIVQTLQGKSQRFSPTAEVICKIVMEHLDGLIELCGESVAVREMRAQLHDYLKGSHKAASFREQSVKVVTRSDVIALLTNWCRAQENRLS
ncbi:MAG TPA: tRNA dihydrouridine synthase DusB [Clostridiaceae bacterium]|nr:tRNA dihydrouridine synthase DusB [Clostridiaceae bacterium]